MMKYEEEKRLIMRFCQVMAETVGLSKRNNDIVEYGIFP